MLNNFRNNSNFLTTYNQCRTQTQKINKFKTFSKLFLKHLMALQSTNNKFLQNDVYYFEWHAFCQNFLIRTKNCLCLLMVYSYNFEYYLKLLNKVNFTIFTLSFRCGNILFSQFIKCNLSVSLNVFIIFFGFFNVSTNVVGVVHFCSNWRSSNLLSVFTKGGKGSKIVSNLSNAQDIQKSEDE